MSRSVKIKRVVAPEGDLSQFDPGAFLAELEFYETDEPISDSDRDDFAQFIHLLAFIALKNRSTHWDTAHIPQTSSAFAALHSHFGGLESWHDAIDQDGISYRSLASMLMPAFPPRRQ